MDGSFYRATFGAYGLLYVSTLAGIVGLCADPGRAQEVIISDAAAGDDLPEYSTEQSTAMVEDQAGLVQHLWGLHCRQGNGCDRWTASVDALMLWRGNVPSVPIFSNDAGSSVVDANDTLPGVSAGPRFNLMRQIGCRHAIEGNYFQVTPFSGNARLPDAGGPFQIADLGGLPSFGDIATGTVLTSGEIRSAELNWRTWNGLAVNWLAGFRWVEWNESMNIDYTFENPDPFGTGSLSASTGNSLYGGQLGADAMLWNRGDHFRLKATGKAGVFFNSAAYQRSDASFTDEAGDLIPVGAVSRTAQQTAFFGEVGLNASFNVTKWLAWRLGYNVFWLSGVATAPQQFAVSDIPGGTAGIDTKGSVLLHGVNTGIEARW